MYNLSPGAGGIELRQHLLVASKIVEGALLPALQLCCEHAQPPSDVLSQLLQRCLSLLATITFNSEGSQSELVLRNGVLQQLLQEAGASLLQRRAAAALFRVIINMDLLKTPPPPLAASAAALRHATLALISKLDVSTASALANEIDGRSDLALDRSGACSCSSVVCGAHSIAGASFVLILEALCDHVYQQPQPTAEPLHSSFVRTVQSEPIDTTDPCLSSAPAPQIAPSPAAASPVKALPTPAPAAAAASSGGHGMVVDAMESLPSIHARRSVIVDSNGATFSVDDVAARRLRKEQRRQRAQAQEAAAGAGAQSEALATSVADEKPNAAAEPWTDVPAEFCCALNGSLIKQPVRSHCVVMCRALRRHVAALPLTLHCRSNPNTGTPSTARVSSNGCSSTPTPAPSPTSRWHPQTFPPMPSSKSASTGGRYSRR